MAALGVKRILDTALKDPVRWQEMLSSLHELRAAALVSARQNRRFGSYVAAEERSRQAKALSKAIRILERLAREPNIPEDLR